MILHDFSAQTILTILVYIGFVWVFIESIMDALDFGGYSPLLVLASFALWQFLLIKAGIPGIILTFLLITVNHFISTSQKRHWQKLNEKALRISWQLSIPMSGHFPPVRVLKPSEIKEGFGISRGEAKKIINAFAINPMNPRIFLFPALVEYFSDDAIAFVISHELGHILLGHLHEQWKKNEQKDLWGILGMAAGAILGGLLSGWKGVIIGGGIGALGGSEVVGGLFVARYSRKQEREADAFGVLYMEQAGFNPSGAFETMEVFERIEGPTSWIDRLWSDHPPAAERSTFIQEVLQNREHYWNKLISRIN